MRKILVAAIAVTSGPAHGNAVLWQNVEVGMSGPQVRELYPESKIAPKVRWTKRTVVIPNYKVGECLSDVTITADLPMIDPAARVHDVSVTGYGCANATFRALVAKYGEPKSVVNAQQDSSVGNDDTRDAIWTREGVTMRYTSEHGGIVSNWTLVYEPTKDIGL